MGMRKLLYSVAIILLTANCCLAYTGMKPQESLIKAGTVKLNQYWQLTLEQDYVADDQGRDICFTQSDMGLVCKPMTDWFELGVNYRRIYQRTEDDPYKAIDRPRLNIALRGQIFAFDASCASRFEYRNQERQKDFWRYGNKFALKFQPLVPAFKLQPYIAYDFSADLNSTSDFASRGFSSGASFKLSQNLTGDFYCRWQTSRYGDIFYDYRVIGTALRFTF